VSAAAVVQRMVDGSGSAMLTSVSASARRPDHVSVTRCQ
jgi:hypothetical protein